MSVSGKPRLDGTRLVAVILESVLYGILWVLLFLCISALERRSKDRRGTIYRPIFMVTCALFLCISGHWLSSTIELYNAFVRPRHEAYCVAAGGISPAESAYLKLSNPLDIASSVFFVATMTIGDWFLIYRTYVIWAYNNWIVIPPIIFSIASLVCGIMVTYLFSRSDAPVFLATNWITALFVLTVACNLYSTSMISMRLISSGQYPRFRVMGIRKKVLEVLIQSAAIYCVLAIFLLSFLLSNSNLIFITTAMTNPVIGINFCLIVIRTDHDKPGVYLVQAEGPNSIEFVVQETVVDH